MESCSDREPVFAVWIRTLGRTLSPVTRGSSHRRRRKRTGLFRGPCFALDDGFLDHGDFLGGWGWRWPRLAIIINIIILPFGQDVLVAAPGGALGDGEWV